MQSAISSLNSTLLILDKPTSDSYVVPSYSEVDIYLVLIFFYKIQFNKYQSFGLISNRPKDSKGQFANE